MRVVRAVLLLSCVAISTARAQSPQASLVDDRIQRVVNSVNDLRYEEAIRDGREILGSSSSLRPQQEVTLRFALAAAHFPESDGPQLPDSALVHLERVLRLAPDATELPVVLAWRGLDSLFAVARSRGLHVAFRPTVDSFVVVGTATSPAIPVVASRPARFRLSTRRVGGAEVTHSASSTPSARAELSLRAVDGGRAVLERGEYELLVTAVDPQRGDSVQSVRRLIVDGAAPTLVPVPMLDSARLRPEERTPRPWHIAAAGGTMALATFFIADGMRATGNIATATTSDSRAGFVGLSILGVTGWAIWNDRKGTDPDAVSANDAVRALHERSLSAATSENARRLAAHRVTVKIAGEGR
jgi:hypothetical protein